MSTSVDTMKNFFNVLKLYANDTTADGVAILDHAIRTTTHFAGLQDAVNHFVADMASVTAAEGAARITTSVSTRARTATRLPTRLLILLRVIARAYLIKFFPCSAQGAT